MNDHKNLTMDSIPCRVCGAEASIAFQKEILNRMLVSYYECKQCGHIQSEEPNWLGESYGRAEWNRDVGLVSRLLDTFHLTFALAWRIGLKPNERCVDFGGGTGLFARLCRDYGLNFYNHDPYAEDLFAHGFNILDHFPARLVTAFEVVEHFPHPIQDFSKIFAFDPEFVFFSTRLYEGQGAGWWYFLENGQHVSVHTPKSLEEVSKKFGYHFYTNHDFHLFSRKAQNPRIIKKLRGYREKFCLRYRKRFGSKIEEDLASVFSASTREEKMPKSRLDS